MNTYVARVAGVTVLLFAAAIGSAGPAIADEWEMPDVKGEILQSAWDSVIAASDGVVVPNTSTAEGPPFEQINLTYWEVCSQSPAAGTQIPDNTPPKLEVARPNAC